MDRKVIQSVESFFSKNVPIERMIFVRNTYKEPCIICVMLENLKIKMVKIEMKIVIISDLYEYRLGITLIKRKKNKLLPNKKVLCRREIKENLKNLFLEIRNTLDLRKLHKFRSIKLQSHSKYSQIYLIVFNNVHINKRTNIVSCFMSLNEKKNVHLIYCIPLTLTFGENFKCNTHSDRFNKNMDKKDSLLLRFSIFLGPICIIEKTSRNPQCEKRRIS
ncbi:hypothetical protein AGLY_008594 [Aphis glycines]|uniref:Uncharacterized protein n=1 Tax=Aphis glycines TaxID=307491 RepID=A0A6G0TKU7_APHGL|nr:hypothetical protein AGLY_008594 [Aphis glycines]